MHDQVEAMALANKVILFNAGKIESGAALCHPERSSAAVIGSTDCT